MDQVAGSARAASDRHWRTERRDRQTASQEIKHEPEEERPFLKPVGQSTQQDDPDDDNDADGHRLDVSPLLARESSPMQVGVNAAKRNDIPRRPHHQGFELSSCGKEPGGTVTRMSKGDAPRGPERIGQGDSVTMRLRAERDSDQ